MEVQQQVKDKRDVNEKLKEIMVEMPLDTYWQFNGWRKNDKKENNYYRIYSYEAKNNDVQVRIFRLEWDDTTWSIKETFLTDMEHLHSTQIYLIDFSEIESRLINLWWNIKKISMIRGRRPYHKKLDLDLIKNDITRNKIKEKMIKEKDTIIINKDNLVTYDDIFKGKVKYYIYFPTKDVVRIGEFLKVIKDPNFIGEKMIIKQLSRQQTISQKTEDFISNEKREFFILNSKLKESTLQETNKDFYKITEKQWKAANEILDQNIKSNRKIMEGWTDWEEKIVDRVEKINEILK